MNQRSPRRRRSRLVTFVALAVSLVGTTLVSASPAAAADVGYVGPSYGGTTQPTAPTAQKPQSKLWYAQGRWWGALWDTAAKDFAIWSYDWASNAWVKTATTLEPRAQVDMDVLWDGAHLYVLANGKGKTMVNPNAELSRYSFDPVSGTYVKNWGPVTIATGLVYSPVIDEDSTGMLWVTYTVGTSVMVTHSSPADPASWVTPYLLPTPNQESTVSFDSTRDPNQPSSDISAVVAFDGDKVGVLWSNQRTEKMYWASHVDGTADDAWTLDTAYAQPEGADDHINLKSLTGDPSGRVYAIAKTSMNGASDALIHLLALSHDGTWSSHVFATVADNATRAMLLLDRENRELYVFASAPCCSGGNIYYKKTSMADPDFEPGLGTVFMQSTAHPKINNATSTKQALDSTTDLLVLAGDDSTRTYMYNRIDLQPVVPPDPTAPDTTITATPAATTESTTADFSFTASEAGSTFECQLDGSAYAACTSPQSYTGLAVGQHTFAVRAVDAAGNADATPATYTWTITETTPPDPTAPDTTITATPEATTESTTAAFSFTASEAGSTFECQLDGSAYAACTSPQSYTGLAVGQHTFAVRAADAAGNADATPATYTWTITDTTPPDTTITATPTSTTQATTAAFSFTASEAGSTFECQLDGSAYAGCTTPQSYAGLALGQHTFSVRATDAGGNVDATPATYTWTITDTTPPETTLTSKPSGSTTQTTAQFAFASSESGSTFECKLDAAAYAACTSPKAYTGLAIGQHTFSVRATDRVGNTDPTPAKFAWKIRAPK